MFLNRLDKAIKSRHGAHLNLISSSDINIDYLTENDRKRQLDSVLQTYNLTAIVTFPARCQGTSSTTIDNIFILQHIHEWFNANLISLNWEKIHFMNFTTKNNSFSNFDIIYKDNKQTTVDSIKFLG